MTSLEDLKVGALVRGILDRAVRVVQVEWHGSDALTLTYTDESGRPGQELLYRDDEPRLAVEGQGRTWSMDADGHLFRLVSEAKRISLAYLFDPFLAVQISTLDPLPHQIDAVYSQMLPRQPLRFLLADDPGAGKTIMAGLFCKELALRGDVERCLVIAPGSLVEQWQDELWSKFRLPFEILTRDMIEASRTGNPLAERPLLIARLDHLSRNEDLQAKLSATDWDLIVADEAHKMAAHYFGREVKETKRYKLGRLAGSVARHLLLMTATPHSGKEEDFQLFMALLDGDRFEGKSRRGVHIDTSDLMRRLVKEELLKFDGTKLFPERRAFTAVYPLSDDETLLYKRVTEYVQEEMNRADRLKAEGEGRRGTVVGFALTTLQRRLASSPEAIYQSLVRRHKRLEARVVEERTRRRDAAAAEVGVPRVPDEFRDADEEFDVDDLPDGELEGLEEELVDEASAARTIAELEWEISRLGELEELAHQVRRSSADRKWEELSNLLQHTPEMFDPAGRRRKLIVFTEHRDTLNYLVGRLRGLFGRTEAVVAIHGQLPRAERRAVQEAFTQDRNVLVLVATDAAGEGINLQRAHLMVNYDLPWNPNRIEQRFGRVHRIGQTEVCSLWNLVAEETREGQVFQRLFEKLEEQRRALGGQVFDVLGEAFRGRSLRELLIDAIRYGEQPEIKQRLELVVDATVGVTLKQVVDERALVTDVLTLADVERIRDEMERADARRLQPHFIRSFLLEALSVLGGTVREREPGRYEVTHVPAELRRRDRQRGGVPLLRRYERITFHKELVTVEGRPLAEFCCPGHPLLDGAIDLIVERYAGLLTQGAVLVDETDPRQRPRVLVYLQHAIQDGRVDRSGNRRIVSKRFEFVEVDREGGAQSAGWAPFLDLRPATQEELELAGPVLNRGWVRDDLERQSLDHGVQQARTHLEEVRRRTLDRVERTATAVKQRLTTEIRYWDRRANQLKDQELAGKLPKSGMNSGKARHRADELEARLARRLDELDAERQLSPLPPVVAGGALVFPAGLLTELRGASPVDPAERARETERVERAAVDAVLAVERGLGRTPVEMPHSNKGYDVESKDPDGGLWFIEVKGRVEGADTVTVTKSEIGVGRNKPDQFILALVEVPFDEDPAVRYLRRPFDGSGDLPFGTISVTFDWKQLANRSEVPT
jgi:superfamily II DNA or RNA helicase